MALAVERAWPEDKKLVGIALTRYGHGLTLERLRWVEAGHPVPDAAGETTAREMLAAARAIKSMDMMLALLSGGGSALLSLPAIARAFFTDSGFSISITARTGRLDFCK